MRSTGEKVTHTGDTVVFECLSHPASHGSSSLFRVDWLKDGQPIATSSESTQSHVSETVKTDEQSSLLKDSLPLIADSELLHSRGSRPVKSELQSQSGRYYLIADSQILVLLGARLSDAGIYTCIVSNAVGSQRAVSTLRVIDQPLTSPNDVNDNDDDDNMLTVRIGLVVIVAVCGIVLTSLAWVVVIYCLQRRHDLADTTSSTSTDETVIPVASSSVAATTEVNTLDSLQHRIYLPPGNVVTCMSKLGFVPLQKLSTCVLIHHKCA